MSNRTERPGDVPVWLAERFRDSYNALYTTDYIVEILKEQDTDSDMRLLDSDGNIKEDIQHLLADPEWRLRYHSEIAFVDIGETLQEAVNKSGLKKDFLLSVLIAPENLPKIKHARIRLVEDLWACLEKRVKELRLDSIKEHGFDYIELEDLCGELIADAFTKVSVTFIDKEYEGNVIRPGGAWSVQDDWIKHLTLGAIQKKTNKYYSNPKDLILLVELPNGPASKTGDISGIPEALQNVPPVFKEVWVGSGDMGGAVRVWPLKGIFREPNAPKIAPK